MICNKIFTFNMQNPSVLVKSWLVSREHITIFCPNFILKPSTQDVLYKANSPGVYLWLIADLYLCHVDQVMHEYIQENNCG